ncbi:histidine kinase [Dyella dinghuensis]|uniref:histidine kinase n=1 Tax=Dyella dinghuensis TaxID=1920169 RepID=A0A432LUF1_9GAMM|nr:ATP-binding protein [Dyella dinghuensis]RUL64214.1 histidine kinase [Dyella dinghuensis]
MYERIKSWLGRVPIDDPVDRRNAIFMQLLLLFEGLRVPLNKVYLVAFHWAYLQDHFYNRARSGSMTAIAIDFGTDLAMTITAWLGIYLIRLGKFKPAVSIYLGSVLCSGAIAYTAFGYQATDGNLTFIMILALSGIMLGRTALWITYAGEAITLIMSVAPIKVANVLHLPPVVIDAYALLPMRALMSYFLIAVIFDRSIYALRQSYNEANEKQKQLTLEIAARERAQEQLLHSQKMDAMGKVASGIAHDMNNIFGIIIGFSVERDRLPIDDSPDDDLLAVAEAMDGIESAARRGTSVCRKLLAFSRHDVAHLEVFDIVAALKGILPLIRKVLPQTVQLQVHVPDDEILVYFDRSQFELATINLASNARDAMPTGGTCTFSIERSDHRVTLSIHDTGIGMPDDVKARIFEPFFTTKSVGDGTGLGLSVVDGLIRGAGGSTAVESELGKGSIIRIRLPIAEPEMVLATPATFEDGMRSYL